MRETCARVLAAALMTGAIATVVGMSALFGGPSQPARPIAAPPSSSVRSVQLVARPGPRQPRPVGRAQPVRRVSTPARQVVVASSLVVTHTKPARQPRRRLAAVRVVTAAPPPDVAPTASPPPPVADPSAESHDDHGRGHAYGHDKHDE